jgi:hypothetical protein
VIDTVEVAPGLTIEADTARDQMLLGFEETVREIAQRQERERLRDERAREDAYLTRHR